jgi:penicillin amidase
MDMARRAGYGRLSEIFGDITLDRDISIRNFGLKEAALKDYEKLSPRMKQLFSFYSQGINSWLDSRKMSWPPEMLVLRYRPERWGLLDSLIIKEVMALLLCVDFPSEIVRSNLVNRLGTQKALEILEEDLKISPGEVETGSLADWMRIFMKGGSNNWVVSGSRTETGRPLLAGDPHLEISVPPIWYEMHLSCPTINAAGVSLPGIPFIIIGHNDSIAWSVTNSALDSQDLYVEKLDAEQEMYWDDGEWNPLLIKEDLVKVRGRKQPHKIDIAWTSRGPIITPLIIQSSKPISLRWVIHDGGQVADSFYLLNKAQNWEEFKEALKIFDAPSQNFVYADKMGNIGYYLSGRIPLRNRAAALFPYPGWEEDGDWRGFLEENKKPTLFNPEDGLIVTANNKIIDDDYPYYLSIDYDVSYRADRIRDLLLQRQNHNIDSFKRIQNDIFSKQGDVLLQILRDIDVPEGDAGEALNILKDWDMLMGKGKEPALFEAFVNFLIEEVLSDELGEEFESFDLLFRRKQAGLLRILDNPVTSWFDKQQTPQEETKSSIILSSLDRARAWLSQEFGSIDDWDWMKIHSIHFQHMLGRSSFFRFFNIGTYPLDGNAFTIRSNYSTGYGTTHGSSYRQIIDLSDLKNSFCVITSGQAGHFLSRFYDDQVDLWRSGSYHPMLFFTEDIEANSKGRLVLRPMTER